MFEDHHGLSNSDSKACVSWQNLVFLEIQDSWNWNILQGHDCDAFVEIHSKGKSSYLEILEQKVGIV